MNTFRRWERRRHDRSLDALAREFHAREVGARVTPRFAFLGVYGHTEILADIVFGASKPIDDRVPNVMLGKRTNRHAGMSHHHPWPWAATASEGQRVIGLSCLATWRGCSWVVVIFKHFPRALSFPSGSSYYNALQFSSGFSYSDVLDQSHFSG